MARETKIICTALKIPDCNETYIEKSEYILLVREAIHRKNESMLRLLAVGKCQRIIGEDYGKKQYISKKNIFNVRVQYRARFGLEKFAGNYSKDRRFSSSKWLCRCKESREEESHLTSGKCELFGDLRGGLVTCMVTRILSSFSRRSLQGGMRLTRTMCKYVQNSLICYTICILRPSGEVY